jgi:hypothetical protein
MKTAKEWADEAIAGAFNDGKRWGVRLEDVEDYVLLEPKSDLRAAIDLHDEARSIIERLVERVQADTRAPLEAEIARLRAENESLRVDVEMYTGVPCRRGDR